MSANIHFEENFEKIDKYINFINNGEKNNESVSHLLLKFFDYYSYYYENNIYYIIIKFFTVNKGALIINLRNLLITKVKIADLL